MCVALVCCMCVLLSVLSLNVDICVLHVCVALVLVCFTCVFHLCVSMCVFHLCVSNVCCNSIDNLSRSPPCAIIKVADSYSIAQVGH